MLFVRNCFDKYDLIALSVLPFDLKSFQLKTGTNSKFNIDTKQGGKV